MLLSPCTARSRSARTATGRVMSPCAAGWACPAPTARLKMPDLTHRCSGGNHEADTCADCYYAYLFLLPGRAVPRTYDGWRAEWERRGDPVKNRYPLNRMLDYVTLDAEPHPEPSRPVPAPAEPLPKIVGLWTLVGVLAISLWTVILMPAYVIPAGIVALVCAALIGCLT
jgi:hypothetical protein